MIKNKSNGEGKQSDQKLTVFAFGVMYLKALPLKNTLNKKCKK